MKKLDLLRTAHSDFIQLSPPDHVLIDDEAQKRLQASGIVFAGRCGIDGAGFGFGTAGAQALQELAALLWNEDSGYRLGTEAGRFLRAVVDSVITDFRARGSAPIQAGQDVALETTLRTWFDSQTFARTFFIPCSILPEHAAAFKVGPVTFLSLKDFIV